MAVQAAAAALLDCANRFESVWRWPRLPGHAVLFDAPTVRATLHGVAKTGALFHHPPTGHLYHTRIFADYVSRTGRCPNAADHATRFLVLLQEGKIPVITVDTPYRICGEDGVAPLLQKESKASVAGLMARGRAMIARMYRSPFRPSIPFWQRSLQALFRPLVHMELDARYWGRVAQIGTHPITHLLFLPLALGGHVAASLLTREISLRESLNEMIDVGNGSIFIGSGILAAIGGWSTINKYASNTTIGSALKAAGNLMSPRLKSFAVGVGIVTTYTFIAMRGSQDHVAERDYPRFLANFGKELAMGSIVHFGVTDGLLWLMGKRMVNPRVALFAAMGIGYFFAETLATHYRRLKRAEEKERDYDLAIQTLRQLPGASEIERVNLYGQLDETFARLLSYNATDAPSVAAAAREGEVLWRQSVDASYSRPQPKASKWLREWVERIRVDESKSIRALRTTVLPAQEDRVRHMFQRGFGPIQHFYFYPIPWEIQSRPHADWGFAHTLSLMRDYQRLQAKLG